MRILITLATTAVLTVGLIGRAQTGWVDPSPHRERLVRVEADVDVEVLDWGGSGGTLVLLAQLGQTATSTTTGRHVSRVRIVSWE